MAFVQGHTSGQGAITGQRTLCVGIDLDDLRFYRRIHALEERPSTPIVFEIALPRFLELCSRLNIKATCFVVGEDLDIPVAREALVKAASDGHEIASHSYAHAYDLSLWPFEKAVSDLEKARKQIEDRVGVKVYGFRAPGYNLSAPLLEAVAKTGHRYDASILPSPFYFLARALIILGMRLAARKSASIIGRPGDFFRSQKPFVWPSVGLSELPISAVMGLPLIGTTLSCWRDIKLLRLFARRKPFVHVEFHAIDFLDVTIDSLEKDLLVEPALRVPLATRLQRFSFFLGEMLLTHRNLRLGDVSMVY